MNPRNPENTSLSSRRSLLKGAVVGATGLAAAGGAAGAAFLMAKNEPTSASAHYDGYNDNVDSIQTIINVAITAETLAVIFYTEVLNNANRLGLNNTARQDLKAALVEEAVHRQFLAKQGAKPLTTKFSFPFGQDTFRRFDKFFQTQQQLEALFVAAYLAAGKEFAMLKRPDLVLVAAQIGGVEAEHRAVGRAIGGKTPANNRSFETALLKKVGDAPGVMKKAGFLGPNRNNSWDYHDASMQMDGLTGWSTSDQDWD
jgi:hypothetical protein